MKVTSFETFNTVYKTTHTNNEPQILLNGQQLKELEIKTQLVMNVEKIVQNIQLRR